MFGKKKEAAESAAQTEKSVAEKAAETAAERAASAARRADEAAQRAAATSEEAERRAFEAYKQEKKLEELHRLIGMIDHTLLRQTATKDEIKKLCAEAVEYGFGAVCVQPVYVSACYSYLRKAPDVKIACVVGFPKGENKTETKVYETKRAVLDGANEIDMVICLSAVKTGLRVRKARGEEGRQGGEGAARQGDSGDVAAHPRRDAQSRRRRARRRGGVP